MRGALLEMECTCNTTTYAFSETVVIEVPLPELFVAFDCSSLIASSAAEVLVEAASHKGLKI